MNWTFEGKPVSLPHVWRPPAISVADEGPYSYHCSVDLESPAWLVFEGVSYQAVVLVNGSEVLRHEGIWDAFAVSLPAGPSTIEVRVTKNGGATFPVRDVLSGFLPYVYQTWGGIHGDVYLSDHAPEFAREVANSRVAVDGTHLLVDDKPFWMRGVLTWGWYPEFYHPHPPLEFIEKEVAMMKEMGFNTVKFCLWLPPHRFLKELNRQGMFAWIELPVWMPSGDPEKQRRWVDELNRIVLQYRHHDNIIAWTVGCELSHETTAEWRREITEWVMEATGCPLVKDNSGGAEMYGGDPREFGTFADFHPYCDGPFFPPVLESLRHGPRPAVPILLGETCDFDQFRDLARLKEIDPDWASDDPSRNVQGVRWQYDWPQLVHQQPELHQWLEEHARAIRFDSQWRADWVRRRIAGSVRMNPDIAGWVLTGWRHTPISTSGYVNDHLELAGLPFTPSFNESGFLALIPRRCPPWVNGGNRVGWHDPHHFFPGLCHFQVGAVHEERADGEATWEIRTPLNDTVLASGAFPVALLPCVPQQVAEISVQIAETWEDSTLPFMLKIRCFDAEWGFPFFVHERIEEPLALDWMAALRQDEPTVVFVHDEAHTQARPFWRECVMVEENGGVGMIDDETMQWPVSCDRFLDSRLWPSDLPQLEPLLTRLDTRTYERLVVVARCGSHIVTTLRPEGGLGAQPPDFARNPAGHGLVRALKALL